MLVHESALKHGIDPEDSIHAAENYVFSAPQSDEHPMPEFRLGFDPHGRLLELTVLVFDSGNQMIIHAMKARPQYYSLLPTE
ncbi:MAG: toxin [Candidatus Nanopelagicales bacterium]